MLITIQAGVGDLTASDAGTLGARRSHNQTPAGTKVR
jgi:hypothetical protein